MRVDFNVPIKDNQVLDDFRIKKSLPGIDFLKEGGAKIILISHLGNGKESLKPVAETLNKYMPVKFTGGIFDSQTEQTIRAMSEGDVVLLENLRQESGEQGKDKNFAEKLASLGDIYVNDAFSVSHREDASVVLLPEFLPAYAGLQLTKEVDNLSQAFNNPDHPFLFILGGAKFSTKMPLIEKYLDLADHVFVGGALANNFLKAKGYEVGNSLTDKDANKVQKLLKNEKLILSSDVITQSGNKLVPKKLTEIETNDFIVDVGEETIKNLGTYIKNAKLILWNGPLGKYEAGGEKGTKQVLSIVANSGAKSIIGGGDTVALISQLNMENKFSFVSTGGGATLEFLATGTLPGLKALE